MSASGHDASVRQPTVLRKRDQQRRSAARPRCQQVFGEPTLHLHQGVGTKQDGAATPWLLFQESGNEFGLRDLLVPRVGLDVHVVEPAPFGTDAEPIQRIRIPAHRPDGRHLEECEMTNTRRAPPAVEAEHRDQVPVASVAAGRWSRYAP